MLLFFLLKPFKATCCCFNVFFIIFFGTFLCDVFICNVSSYHTAFFVFAFSSSLSQFYFGRIFKWLRSRLLSFDFNQIQIIDAREFSDHFSLISITNLAWHYFLHLFSARSPAWHLVYSYSDAGVVYQPIWKIF